MLSHLFQNTRKIRYQQFRKKRGVFNYKKTGAGKTHKRPGLIDVKLKNDLLKMKKAEAFKRIQELEASSYKLFGKWQGKNFIFDESKVPKYDIPDLTGFDLKPYVSYKTPLRLPDELFQKLKKVNDFSEIKLN